MEYMQTLRRERKDQAIDQELRQRFIRSRNDMLQAFGGLSPKEKLDALRDLNELLTANM